MIDTVGIFYPVEIEDFRPRDGWKFTHSVKQDSRKQHGSTQIRTTRVSHEETGYSGQGSNGILKFHQVSLARLLHGSNGQLIKSQAEVEAAMNLFIKLATTWGHAVAFEYRLTRVDLAWQFPGRPDRFIHAHREVSHPKVRRPVVRYKNGSLTFDGTKVRILFYDKTKEMLGRKGEVVRVEVQLKSQAVTEELGIGEPVRRLDFMACYQVYRRYLLMFQPSAVPEANGIAGLLAHGERAGCQIDGRSLFEIYTANLSARQKSRLRRDMRSLVPEVHQIDWSQMLPFDQTPPLLEVIA